MSQWYTKPYTAPCERVFSIEKLRNILKWHKLFQFHKWSIFIIKKSSKQMFYKQNKIGEILIYSQP